jgi:tRNA A37 threonylcarbamoyladenosine biosynthesis protein TsaE
MRRLAVDRGRWKEFVEAPLTLLGTVGKGKTIYIKTILQNLGVVIFKFETSQRKVVHRIPAL